MALSFAFDPSKGETPETLANRRRVAESLMGQTLGRTPRNLGEGLTSIANAFMVRTMLDEAKAGEDEGKTSGNAAFASLFGGGADSVPTPGAATLASPTPVAQNASEMQAPSIDAKTAFAQAAPNVIGRLTSDFNLSPQQAAGIVGQLGHESEGLQAINERNPLVPGSRGGFGWAQWTGPRRKAFEAYAQSQGLDVTSPEANYGFLKTELMGPEGRVLDSVRAAPDARSAGRAFTDGFLRPGNPGYASRDRWTDRASALAGAQTASLDPSVAQQVSAPTPTVTDIKASPRAAVAQALAARQRSGPSTQDLMKASSNPWLSKSQRTVVDAMLKQRMEEDAQQSDPLRQLQIQKLQMDVTGTAPLSPKDRLDMENTRLGMDKTRIETDRLKSGIADVPNDVREYKFYADQEAVAGRKPLPYGEYQQSLRKSGASTISIDQKAESEMDKAFGQGLGKTFNGLYEGGVNAGLELAQIDQLEGFLKQSGSGLGPAIVNQAAKFGLDLAPGASPGQAAGALINKLVPTQRLPGSGTMSDADLALFKQSLPSLMNTPEGNALIMQTMRGVAEHKRAQGDIAGQVFTREITPKQAMEAIRGLPDPFARFKELQKSAPPAPVSDEGWQTLPGGVRIRRKG